MRAALAATIATVVLHSAHGFIYEMSHVLNDTYPVYRLTEGPMYAGSTLGFSGVAAARTDERSLQSLGVRLHVLAADSSNLDLIGWPYPGLARSESDTSRLDVCCTTELLQNGQCGMAEDIGDVIVRVAERTSTGAPVRSVLPHNVSVSLVATSTNVRASFAASREGAQYLVLVLCSRTGATVPITISGSFAFRNPGGYLPGTWTGSEQIFAAMFAAYVVFVIVFGAMLVVHRQHVLPLQLVLLGVGIAGLVEVRHR